MSEMISIFDKIEVLNKLNEEIKTNIKHLYIFRDVLKEINVILVTNEDKVYCCGPNYYGVLGFGHLNSINEFTINEELSDKRIIDFRNGSYHTIARDSNGKLYCWGTNIYLGNGREDYLVSKPELNKYLINENIIDMCCGFGHTLVLTSNNEVYGWGYNYWGQIGNGNRSDGFLSNVLKPLLVIPLLLIIPILVIPLPVIPVHYWGKTTSDNVVFIPIKINKFNKEKVKAISCGLWHSMALTESGCVYSWGYNSSGQLGLNSKNESENKPQRIQIDVKFNKISCGSLHNLLLSREGDIYVCGSNECRQLGIETKQEKQLNPIKLSHSEKFTDIASNYKYNISAALSENGLYYVWGECGDKEIYTELKETKFRSFDEIFVYFLRTTVKSIQHLFQIQNNFIPNGKYTRDWTEITKIGEGSYGTVFKVQNKIIEETIFAIKKNPIKEDYNSLKLVNSKLILGFNSDHLVKYYDIWYENDFKIINGFRVYIENKYTIYIQMDLCDKTLSDIIKEIKEDSKLFTDKSLTQLGYYLLSELFIEILKGVKYLHNNKTSSIDTSTIIHRHLNPHNILVKRETNGNCIKIGGFGFGVRVREMNKLQTQDRRNVKYHAPELLKSSNCDTKADIFSLGVILEELFDIGFKRSNNYFPNMVSKYECLERLIESMTSRNPNNRPNCQRILEESENWAINANEFNIEEELNLLEISNENRSYVQNIIHSKLHNVVTCNFSHEFESNMEKETKQIYRKDFIELELIGFGSFGIVCKAIEIKNGRIFAIKKIPIIDDLKKEKISQEIEIWSKLESEHMVKFEKFWIENNYYNTTEEIEKKVSSSHELFKEKCASLLHIQMEICYKTLKEITKVINIELTQKESEVMSPLGYYISSEIFIEILECVRYLHNQNIIHRDLKPSNILITDGANGQFVKLADFGLATMHVTEEQTHTQMKGSVKYAAPEVMRGRIYNTKADIFSLGVICQDLFNIDLNQKIDANKDLKLKYSKLYEMAERMLSVRMDNRPDCGQILDEKNLWALSLTQLTKLTNLKMSSKIVSIEESFHKFFIQTKLKYQLTNG